MITLIYYPILYALFLISASSEKNPVQICGNTYRHKDNGYLFQDVKKLTLHCDSTFTWKHESCTQHDTCYGTWRMVNGTIELTTDKKLLKIIKKEKWPDDAGKYIDLSRSALTLKDSFLIWRRTDTWTDTLYRR